ncbi:MAG: hypothetical protein PHP62_04920 [Candidatus Moranbacteria bacterium]|nr:hypothetical protein [Candidatus Moranbacteria bacterium]
MSKKLEQYERFCGDGNVEVVDVVVRGRGISGRKRSVMLGAGKKVRDNFEPAKRKSIGIDQKFNPRKDSDICCLSEGFIKSGQQPFLTKILTAKTAVNCVKHCQNPCGLNTMTI